MPYRGDIYGRGTTPQRGYGWKHQQLRKSLLPAAIGTPCARCGKPMLASQPLDLDHSDDRSTYLGFSHAECNRRAAADKVNNARRNASPRGRSNTRW